MFNLMKTSHAVLLTDFSDEKRREKKTLSQRKETASHNDYLSSLFVSLTKKGCICVFRFIYHGSYYVYEI